MNKILTISIAAYNVEKYIQQLLESLLINDLEKIEVLIQLDGGSDNTKQIASKYVSEYPSVFKIIEKVNGGYGSTINKSIELASGKYFKQLDGDDWYDTENLEKLVFLLDNIDVDVVYNPYVEVWISKNEKELIQLLNPIKTGVYKLNDIITGHEDILKMHALLYKTDILKKNNIRIEENCFYTDTEYVLYPISNCIDIYISDLSIYFYRLGIPGQSVSKEKRRKYVNDHTIVINKLLSFIGAQKNQTLLLTALKIYVSKIFVGQLVFMLYLPVTIKNRKKIKDFDQKLKQIDIDMYKFSAKYGGKTVKVLRKTNYLFYYLLAIKRNLSKEV